MRDWLSCRALEQVMSQIRANRHAQIDQTWLSWTQHQACMQRLYSTEATGIILEASSRMQQDNEQEKLHQGGCQKKLMSHML